ncbi:MAG: hypothetical protein AB7N80_01805 [Bdellovibrionales bacterium]
MKKTLLVLTLALSTLAIGCADDPKETAKKMGNKVSAADNLAEQGVQEQDTATRAMQIKLLIDGEMVNWSEADLQKYKTALLGARSKMASAAVLYNDSLKMDKKNDNVTFLNPSAITRNINLLNERIAVIDKDVASIDKAIADIKAGVKPTSKKGIGRHGSDEA